MPTHSSSPALDVTLDESRADRMSSHVAQMVTQSGLGAGMILAGLLHGRFCTDPTDGLYAYVAIRRGLVASWTNGIGYLDSFAKLCVRQQRLDILREVTEAGWPKAAGADAGRSKAQWLDELCSYDTNFMVLGAEEPARSSTSLFQIAVDPLTPSSKQVLEYAFSVAPEHPAIARMSSEQTDAGALVREVAMGRMIAAEMAGAVKRDAPPGRRRAML